MAHDRSISIAKGIAILMMVMHHGGWSHLSPSFGTVFNTFCMPLFFICSGYLFSLSRLDAPAAFYKRRLRGLYLPFVKYGLIFLALHNVLAWLYVYPQTYDLSQTGLKAVRIITMNGNEQLLGGYWFLVEAFIASVMVFSLLLVVRMLLRRATSSAGYFGRVSATGVFALLTVMFVISASLYGLLPFKIPKISGVTLTACAYFTAGWLLRHVRERISWPAGLMLVAVATAAHFLWKPTMLHWLSGTDFPIYFLISTAASAGVMVCCGSISGAGARVLDYVGARTLPILTFHFLSFKAVSVLKCQVYGLPYSDIGCFPVISEHDNIIWATAYTAVGVGLPLIYAAMSRRIASRVPALGRI